MKVRVAIFKSQHIDIIACDEDLVPDEYTRITEWVNVHFPERAKKYIIKEEVNALNKEIEETKEVTINRLKMLETRKQELLALGST